MAGPDVFGQLTDGVLTVQQRPDQPQSGVIGEELQNANRLLDMGIICVFNCMRIHAYRMPSAKPHLNAAASNQPSSHGTSLGP